MSLRGGRLDDPTDPWAEAVYAAHDAALGDVGPAFTFRVDAERFVDAVCDSLEWSTWFPNAPVNVAVQWRSTSARVSWALPTQGEILLAPDGRNGPVILHELAHLTAPGDGHGGTFVAAHLRLVRRFCGFHAFGAYQEELRRRGVPGATPIPAG